MFRCILLIYHKLVKRRKNLVLGCVVASIFNGHVHIYACGQVHEVGLFWRIVDQVRLGGMWAAPVRQDEAAEVIPPKVQELDTPIFDEGCIEQKALVALRCLIIRVFRYSPIQTVGVRLRGTRRVGFYFLCGVRHLNALSKLSAFTLPPRHPSPDQRLLRLS